MGPYSFDLRFSGYIDEIERFLTKKSPKTAPVLVEAAQEN